MSFVENPDIVARPDGAFESADGDVASQRVGIVMPRRSMQGTRR
jgi:hypothetical protein